MSGTKVILIVGPRFAGKSRFVEQFLPRLRETGLTPAGFFQRGVFDKEGGKTGYDLVSAGDGTSVPLARRAGADCPWQFDETAFSRAAEMIAEGADVCILDEIGPLELSGGGHAQTLETALAMKFSILIIVREELADALYQQLPAYREIVVLQFERGEEDKLGRRILDALQA